MTPSFLISTYPKNINSMASYMLPNNNGMLVMQAKKKGSSDCWNWLNWTYPNICPLSGDEIKAIIINLLHTTDEDLSAAEATKNNLLHPSFHSKTYDNIDGFDVFLAFY